MFCRFVVIFFKVIIDVIKYKYIGKEGKRKLDDIIEKKDYVQNMVILEEEKLFEKMIQDIQRNDRNVV